MELARVMGQVVATVKQTGLHGTKLLVLESVTADDVEFPQPESGRRQQFVAVDYAGAGYGEVVLVAHGSAARIDGQGTAVPTDAAVVAIVDSIVMDRKTTFRKSG